MANLSQHVLVRTDLGFSRGLMAAQVAHIHAQIMRANLNVLVIPNTELLLSPEMKEWLEAPVLIVHGVPNMETLEHFTNLASHDGIAVNSWRDTVFSEVAPDLTLTFKDVLVGASLGPDDSDAIKAILGKLPLLP